MNLGQEMGIWKFVVFLMEFLSEMWDFEKKKEDI